MKAYTVPVKVDGEVELAKVTAKSSREARAIVQRAFPNCKVGTPFNARRIK